MQVLNERTNAPDETFAARVALESSCLHVLQRLVIARLAVAPLVRSVLVCDFEPRVGGRVRATSASAPSRTPPATPRRSRRLFVRALAAFTRAAPAHASGAGGRTRLQHCTCPQALALQRPARPSAQRPRAATGRSGLGGVRRSAPGRETPPSYGGLRVRCWFQKALSPRNAKDAKDGPIRPPSFSTPDALPALQRRSCAPAAIG